MGNDLENSIARAIAKNGLGREWDDINAVDAFDIDQNDLIECASAAIAAYEAERDKKAVTDGLDFIQKTIDDAAAKTITPASEIRALVERVRELEEALKPFAEYAAFVAREHPGWNHDAFFVGLPDAYARGFDAYTLAPFRRARDVLEGKK